MKKTASLAALTILLSQSIAAMDQESRSKHLGNLSLPIKGAVKISAGLLSCMYGLSQFGLPIKFFSSINEPTAWSVIRGASAISSGTFLINSGILNLSNENHSYTSQILSNRHGADSIIRAMTIGIPVYTALYHSGHLK